jgi:hypothetical protein
MSSNNGDLTRGGGSGGGWSWWMWLLALVGAIAVARFAFGLIWGLLPVILVGLALYGGYRMLTSDTDDQSALKAPDLDTDAAHRTTVSKRSGSTQDDAALDSLKQRMQAENAASGDDEARMRRKQQELDEFDRKLAELEDELDEDSNRNS